MRSAIIAIITILARITLRRFRPFVIGVTGSVGKTSTKDCIGAVLEHAESPRMVRRSKKSMNSEIGLPLTILGLPNAWRSPIGWIMNIAKGFAVLFGNEYPKILVLEIGADHPGDIKRYLSWLRLDMVVVTRLPDTPVHVEYYASKEEARDEEWSLVKALKFGGVAILNSDDEHIMARRKEITQNVLTYGFGPLAMMSGREPQINYTESNERFVPKGMAMNVDWKDQQAQVALDGVLGEQLLTSALAGLVVGCALGYELKDVIEGVQQAAFPPGRMRIIEGKNGSTLIDDSYNASPVAMQAALNTLHAIRADGVRKIAMLGDMLELGDFAEEEHRKIGALLNGKIDLLITVGKRALWIADEAVKTGVDQSQVYMFATSEEAGEWMHHHVQEGDVILFKGSQGSGENRIRMEEAVKQLMLRQEQAPDLLVRQEEEWQLR